MKYFVFRRALIIINFDLGIKLLTFKMDISFELTVVKLFDLTHAFRTMYLSYKDFKYSIVGMSINDAGGGDWRYSN